MNSVKQPNTDANNDDVTIIRPNLYDDVMGVVSNMHPDRDTYDDITNVRSAEYEDVLNVRTDASKEKLVSIIITT